MVILYSLFGGSVGVLYSTPDALHVPLQLDGVAIPPTLSHMQIMSINEHLPELVTWIEYEILASHCIALFIFPLP